MHINIFIKINILTNICYLYCFNESESADHFETPWSVALQAKPSMGFSRQGYRSGLPFPSPEDLPIPGIEPWSPTLQADS